MAERDEHDFWGSQWRDERIRKARADYKAREASFACLKDQTTSYALSLKMARDVAAQVLALLEASPKNIAAGVATVVPAEVKVTDAGWAQLWVHGVHIQSGYGQEAKEKCDELAERINAAAGVPSVAPSQLQALAALDRLGDAEAAYWKAYPRVPNDVAQRRASAVAEVCSLLRAAYGVEGTR